MPVRIARLQLQVFSAARHHASALMQAGDAERKRQRRQRRAVAAALSRFACVPMQTVLLAMDAGALTGYVRAGKRCNLYGARAPRAPHPSQAVFSRQACSQRLPDCALCLVCTVQEMVQSKHSEDRHAVRCPSRTMRRSLISARCFRCASRIATRGVRAGSAARARHQGPARGSRGAPARPPAPPPPERCCCSRSPSS